MSEKTIFDGSDLVVTMHEKVVELEKALSELLSGGVALATAERDYRKVSAEWSERLRNDGLSMSMIDKTILGIEEVADARYQRDLAEAIYEARKERINCTKLEIRILESQISREFGKYAGV